MKNQGWPTDWRDKELRVETKFVTKQMFRQSNYPRREKLVKEKAIPEDSQSFPDQ